MSSDIRWRDTTIHRRLLCLMWALTPHTIGVFNSLEDGSFHAVEAAPTDGNITITYREMTVFSGWMAEALLCHGWVRLCGL